jgi:cobalt-zinc-cadmium resistance protein CzcA
MVPQIRVLPRRQSLGRFHLTMEGLQSFLSSALGGSRVGEIWEGDRSFDIVLRLPETARNTAETISNLRVPTEKGALVPLEELADVGVAFGRAAINRENGQRYVGIRMNVRGRDLGSFVRDAQKAVREHVPVTSAVSMEWGGEFESKERAMNRLLVVVPVALVITLGLLFNAFRSLPLALLVLFNVPFALIGGALGLYWMDMPMSIAAAVGFIALVGQASLNGVLVLSSIEARRAQGAELDVAVVEGSRERLRAVLMTAALAAFGLVPAAVSKAMGAETQRPIAVVIVGGTVSAALLTLVVLPVLYRLIFGFSRSRAGQVVDASAVAHPAEASASGE